MNVGSTGRYLVDAGSQRSLCNLAEGEPANGKCSEGASYFLGGGA